MTISWKRRLGISISIIWLLLCIAGYLFDPSKNLRTSLFGIAMFGVIPVAIGWLAWWVYDGIIKK